MFFRQVDEFFEIEEKIITMTCRGFSDSSDASAPEFSILAKSYVATFFYLASKCYTNLCIAGHDFLLHLVAATSSGVFLGFPLGFPLVLLLRPPKAAGKFW